MSLRKVIRVTSLALGLSVASGCTNSEDAEAGIKDAIIQNQELENGRFESSLLAIGGGEEDGQKAEGAFVRTGDSEYDWYKITFFGGDQSNYSETLEVDGKQFDKITIPEQETEWREATQVSSLFNTIGPLLEEKELAVDSVSTEEINGVTSHTLTLNESHGEQIKQENVDALKETIVALEESGTSEEVIEGVEAEIAIREQTEYTDFTYTYQIDEEGYLTSVEIKGTFTLAEGDSYEVITTFTLTEYNVEDTTDFIPAVEWK